MVVANGACCCHVKPNNCASSRLSCSRRASSYERSPARAGGCTPARPTSTANMEEEEEEDPPTQEPGKPMTNTNNNHVPVLFWNPGIPYQLLLPSPDENNSNNNNNNEEVPQGGGGIVVRGAWSTSGVGCNHPELEALSQMVQAHEDYCEEDDHNNLHHQQQQSASSSSSSSSSSFFDAVRTASHQYRAAIRDCLRSWESSLLLHPSHNSPEGGSGSDSAMGGNDDHHDNDNDDQQQVELQNLELLKSSYSFLHLSDVLLPLLLPPEAGTVAGALVSQPDPFDVPGFVTADLIRYLRHNHMMAASTVTTMEELLDSSAAFPEAVGGDGAPYWNLVESLVLRGCLDKAWNVLSKHSSYAQAKLRTTNTDEMGLLPDDVMYALEQIVQEFESLQLVLLRAPIPGGTSDRWDDATSHDDAIENVDYFMEQDDDFAVQPTDYLYWEKDRRMGGGGGGGGNNNDDTTTMFLGSLALRKHQLWQDYVRDMRRKFPLARRVPQIDSILAILSGDLSHVTFHSWVDQFCAELLFVQPHVTARSIGARARRIITKFHEPSQSPLNPFLSSMLSVMDGDVGLAVDLVWIMGGASGAALPSTLTALLFGLFRDAGIVLDDESDRTSEFLCHAASSIVSSLDPATGVLLAVRLLVPSALQQGNPAIVSAIANILEHHCPLNDVSTNNLIALCRPLINRQSVEVLDGCCALVLARHSYYMELEQYGDAVHWLRRGIDLEAVLLPVLEQGACHRTLVSHCWNVSRELALGLLEADEEAAQRAEQVALSTIEGLQGDTPADVSQISAVQVLKALTACCQINFHSKELGDRIAACLRQQPPDNPEGTVRRCLAPVSLHWLLLQIAEKIIRMDENSVSQDPSTCAFDSAGVTLLMERLLQFRVLHKDNTSSVVGLSDNKVLAMQATFAKALARAFIAKNARLKDLRAARGRMGAIPSRINSASLKHLSIQEQEHVVQKMLEF